MNVQYEMYDQNLHNLSEQMLSLSMETEALRQITHRSSVDPEIQRRLDHIDRVALMLEEKMNALEDLVRQDLAAVRSILPVIKEFQMQNQRVATLIEHLEAKENQQQQQQQYQQAVYVEKEEDELNRQELHEEPQNQRQPDPTLQATPHNYYTRSRAKSQPHPEKVMCKQFTRRRAAARRDSLDIRKKPVHSEDFLHDIRLRRVTQSELSSVSKMTRGRISVIAVNDALIDIERFIRNRHVPNNNKTDLMMLFRVTEQELRQSCAFFRSGEATARTVLQVLRSLHRLKQIPCKRENTALYEIVME